MKSWIAAALATCTVFACAGTTGKFHGDREEFLANTRTLLVFPMESPQFDAGGLKRIDRHVRSILEAGGYALVDGNDLDPDEPRAQSIDAVLFKGLVQREAQFDELGAKWDGVDVPVELPSSGPYALSDDIIGVMPTVSLYVSITDFEGNPLYEGFGGIGLLVEWNGEDYVPIEPAKLLADDGAVRRATEVALEALVR